MPNDSGQPVRKSPRRQGYDYTQAASYLVTAMVDHREWRFGVVEGGNMTPNRAGLLVEAAWLRIPDRFAGVQIDLYVVMPNHFHGIIFIGADPETSPPSLSRVMQVFKSESAVEYGRGIRTGHYPAVKRALWQRSFHDDVIQGSKALEMARKYIEENPRKWQDEMDRRDAIRTDIHQVECDTNRAEQAQQPYQKRS